jgi:trehalose 6-phosphate synthase/phosphatase
VLSELAGAASELAEAILVNPYDVDRMALALRRALTMHGTERRARMRALRRRVRTYDVHSWVRSFLRALDESATPADLAVLAMTPEPRLQELVERLRRAQRLLLVLDYDGTLVPYASVPELAMPDEWLLALLGALAARPGTEIHLVSGSSREAIESWFGELPIALYAEHGFWSRALGTREWTRRPMPPQDWREQARPILENFAARTPGSLVEEKTAGMAWHYRMAEPVFGAFQANELRIHLTQLLSNVPVEVLNEDRVIELRPFGVDKGTLMAPLLPELGEGGLIVAMGDDRTDEELFAALPASAISIHVGASPSRGEIRLPDVDAARRLLESLLDVPVAAAV